MSGGGADVETVVVGAGHAGLAASWALHELDLEHVVLEEGRIGQTWRADRWDSFRLNTPRWMSRLPAQPLEAAQQHGYDTATEFADALEAYARLHRLPVREHAGGARIERGRAGLVVHTPARTYAARHVIVATGFQKLATRPPLETALPRRILQLDTTSYRSPGELPDGSVLVAGGGQSGCQIAEDLVLSGRRVVLATSMVGRVPRRYRGRDILGWWTENGFYERRRRDVATAVTAMRQPIVSGTDGGHTLSLQSLARQGVALVGRLVAVDGEELRFDGGTAGHVEFGDRTSTAFRRAIDDYIANAGIDAEPARPDAAEEPYPGLGVDAPRSLRLDRLGVGTVIWCAGMRPRLDVIGIPGLVRGSAVEHTDGMTAVEGLFVMGAPWLSTRKSGIIWGAAADAERIARLVQTNRGRSSPPHPPAD